MSLFMVFYNDPHLLEPKTMLNTFVILQTITRNVFLNSAEGTLAAEEFLNTTSRVSDDTLISGWGITGLTTWGLPPISNITHLRINGYIFRITTIGAFNFYGYFTNEFDNKIDSPYSIRTPISSFETGYVLIGAEYPPIALTSDSTVVSGQSYGNGTYTLSSTTQDTTNALQRFRAFDKAVNTYFSPGLGHYNVSGIYQGPTTGVYVVPNVGIGDWLQIDLPQAITLTSYSIQARRLNDAEGQSPSTWIVAGYNGTTWDILDNSNIAKTQWFGTTTAGEIVARTVTTSTSYSSYLLFSNRITNQPATFTTLAIAEWRLFGY